MNDFSSIQAVSDAPQELVLTGKEREQIIGSLLGRKLNTVVLTPLQRLAILQEQQLQEQGLPPFSDPFFLSALEKKESQEFRNLQAVKSKEQVLPLIRNEADPKGVKNEAQGQRLPVLNNPRSSPVSNQGSITFTDIPVNEPTFPNFRVRERQTPINRGFANFERTVTRNEFKRPALRFLPEKKPPVNKLKTITLREKTSNNQKLLHSP